MIYDSPGGSIDKRFCLVIIIIIIIIIIKKICSAPFTNKIRTLILVHNIVNNIKAMSKCFQPALETV